MKVKQLLVVKETREGESRVALTPETITLLAPRSYRILVESGAGLLAGFTDADYIKMGAEIFSPSLDGFPRDTLILRVKLPSKTREQFEKRLFQENTCMLGFLDPLDPVHANDRINTWQAFGITTFSVDLFKSLSINDPKNFQAAMSRIAGILAFQDGLQRYQGPNPPKLTLIGTGPASYNAALEAKKIGMPVQVFGRKEQYREMFESSGVVYRLIPKDVHQVEFIRQYLQEETIIIAAARTPGIRSSMLIDEKSLCVLPNGAVIIDLTVNEGGSVAHAKSDQAVIFKGISIVHVSGYPKAKPHEASQAYARCLVHLLQEVLFPEGELILDHNLLQECWVTHKGKSNPAFLCLEA